LAPSPLQRPAASGRPGQPGQFQRAHLPERVLDRNERFDRSDRGYERTHGEVAYTGELQRRYDRTSRDLRDSSDGRDVRESTVRTSPARRVSQREVVRRRRANVLFALVMLTAATLFLAATTKSSAMVYAFAFAFVSLCGYCYKLAQLRQYEYDRTGADAHWYHAA
jgi:hypothetical protein